MNGSEFISKAELIILLEQYYILILNWLNTNLFTLESFIQLVVIFVLFLISYGVAQKCSPFVHKVLTGKIIYRKSILI